MLTPRLDALNEDRRVLLHETERLIEDGERGHALPGLQEKQALAGAFDRIREIDRMVDAGGIPPPASSVAETLGRLEGHWSRIRSDPTRQAERRLASEGSAR